MRTRGILFGALAVVVLFYGGISAQTTEFGYQGSLKDGANPATGNYDLEFALFDAVGGGAQLGPTLSRNSVAVANGIFSVHLDFGNQFPGSGRFLEIRVRPSGVGGFTTLAPRQPVSSAPYSVKSLNADNAANAATANNALSLGGVVANQYLQTNGNGSALTNLNAGSIATGTLDNARLGQIPTANLADSAVTAAKIAPGQVVKGVTVAGNTLTDNITLAAGSNMTLTPAGNTVTFNSLGGVGGTGTPGTVPVWSSGTTLGNSLITQDSSGIQLPNNVQLAAGAQGNNITFGSPNGETGMTISGAPFNLRADIRFGGNFLKMFVGETSAGPPARGIYIHYSGNVGIGPFQFLPDQALSVTGNASKSVGGSTWAIFSDERLKNIKGRFTPGLHTLLQLQPIQFQYKADNPLGLIGGPEVGFSAQAVQKVLPEAVSRTEQGYLQIHSDPIMWTMLNAIKEQQAEIATLQKANSALTGRLRTVERALKKRPGRAGHRR